MFGVRVDTLLPIITTQLDFRFPSALSFYSYPEFTKYDCDPIERISRTAGRHPKKSIKQTTEDRIMKRKLPVIFAMTAFVAGTAIAEWPKIKVHEHSLAYNYPGSEYELIQHAGSGDGEEGSAVNTGLNDETKAAGLPKIRVHEHSLAYNYPGSEYELIPHAGSDSNDGNDVDKTDSKNDESVDTKDSNEQRGYISTFK